MKVLTQMKVLQLSFTASSILNITTWRVQSDLVKRKNTGIMTVIFEKWLDFLNWIK